LIDLEISIPQNLCILVARLRLSVFEQREKKREKVKPRNRLNYRKKLIVTRRDVGGGMGEIGDRN